MNKLQPENLKDIVSKIKTIKKRELTDNEIIKIVGICYNLRNHNFSNEDIANTLASNIDLEISNLFNISMWELKKLTGTSPTQIIYVTLNTNNCQKFSYYETINNVQVLSIRRNLNWYVVDTPLSTPISGTTITYKPLKNIVGMRLLPMMLPNDTLNLFPSNIFTIFIKELEAQSYIATNYRYHFMATSTQQQTTNAVNEYLELSPREYNNGHYMFDNPIKMLTSITLEIRNCSQICGVDSFTLRRNLTVSAPNTLSFPTGNEILDGNSLKFNGAIFPNGKVTNNFVTLFYNTIFIVATFGATSYITIDMTGTTLIVGDVITNVIIENLDLNMAFNIEFICET